MKLSDELYVLQLPLHFGGAVHAMNLSLIHDRDHGLTLVDTGVPGQAEQIKEQIEAEGFAFEKLRQIVLTHQDLDHVGSLHVLKDLTGVPIYAPKDEVPYIDGTLRMIKAPSPERIAENPGLGELFNMLEPTHVDFAIEVGEVLEFASGAIAVPTRGHTPGHMSLYLPATKTLIAGDALTAQDGVLAGPSPTMTPNLVEAKESVRRLADLDVEVIVCYHGGIVDKDASSQLKRLAEVA